MDIPINHIFDWYLTNKKLIERTVWKVKYRADCGNEITYDDLMGHCLDKLPTVFKNYSPDKGTKLSTFVMGSLYFECMKYITRHNKLLMRYKSFDKLCLSNQYGEQLEGCEDNTNVKYIEDDDLSDTIFLYLETILTATELRLILLKIEGLTFDEMAEVVGWNSTKMQREYWYAFYKARKLVVNKFKE